MVKNFLTPINLNGLELLNPRLQQLASAPASPTSGIMYYDTTRGNARVYGTSSWVDLVAAVAYTDQNAQDAFGALVSNGTQSGITVTYSTTNHTLNFSIASDAVAGTPSLRTLGTGAQQAASGSDSRLSDARNPIAGSVTNASVATNASISSDKLADGTTNGVYTIAERGKLAGIATGATNYTDTNTRANRLDQFAAPTSAVAMNSQKLTGLADPTNSQDAATKNYVDANAQGLDFKASVALATAASLPANTYANGSSGVGATLTATANAALSIDSVAVTTGSRVLVKNESTAANNGIYVVTNPGSASAAYVLTRATDSDTGNKLNAGALTYVESGATNATQQWVLSTTGAITVGTTALAFTQFSGASTTTAGNGLAASGNTFNVGQGAGIVVGTDAVSIDTTVVVRKYAVTIGDGSTTSFAIAHGLNSQDVVVRVYRVASPYDEVEVDIQHTSTTQTTVIFASAPATNSYRVVVQG